MALSEKELEQLEQIVETAVQKGHEERCEFCMNEDRRKEHRKDHELLRDLRDTLDKLSGIKWTVLRNLLSALVVAGTLAAIALTWSAIKN